MKWFAGLSTRYISMWCICIGGYRTVLKQLAGCQILIYMYRTCHPLSKRKSKVLSLVRYGWLDVATPVQPPFRYVCVFPLLSRSLYGATCTDEADGSNPFTYFLLFRNSEQCAYICNAADLQGWQSRCYQMLIVDIVCGLSRISFGVCGLLVSTRVFYDRLNRPGESSRR